MSTLIRSAPVLLLIFDGFGLNPNRTYNGWALARTPHLDFYFATSPHTALQASGRAVGLPDGQFGNSEVGHLTLGCGRILKQDLERITESLANDTFARLAPWQQALHSARRLHLIGLVSDGGVHSHIEHLLAILPLVVAAGVEPVIHMITDGRDTSPQCADRFVAQVEGVLQTLGRGIIATISGRYYAMDRAGYWVRTEKAWAAMVHGTGNQADSAKAAVRQAWNSGTGDEFILPTVIGDPDKNRIAKDEPIFFFNYRSDRMRQLAAAFGSAIFTGFDRHGEAPRRVTCMTVYDAHFPFPVLFPTEVPEKVLAEALADTGQRQFHCAESEKYAHVTYFFNGGREEPFPGEDRAIIPSPPVATYDLQPEMSAPRVADRVIAAIDSRQYDFILVNLANGDMVGHTAKIPAILRAVESLDLQSHRMIQAALTKGFRILLTADHGNCDEMVDPASGQPHTRHTVYPVPCLLLGMPNAHLGIGRGLADVAPTILDLMDLPVPQQMTGQSLLLKGQPDR
ncbi:MAG: 2,3-bisphosphoglycerate-independent phosphoglycerate mutase [Acidiferrobacter sp.]